MKKKGFTLIEIVVVAAIIGVLAALLLPKLSGQTQKAKEKKAKADMVQIATSLSMVKLDNPSVTKYCKLEDLDNPASSPPTQDAEGNSATFSNWNGPYMVFNETSKGANTSVPDDPWGNDYLLDISTVTANGYATLRSYGKDGPSGGTLDDITHKFF
jgi:general secretion pathway protein G